MQKTFTNEQLDFIRDNFDKMTYKEIGAVLNRDWRAINHQVRKMGLVKKQPEWTDEEEQFLKDNIGILTYEEMSHVLVRTRSSVQSKISKMKLGETPPKYTYNANYFENINTADKAYWLGFMMADGCIAEKSGGYLRVQIALKRDDKEHLEKFVRAIDGDMSVKEVVSKVKGKCHETALLTINSHKMANDLIKHGVVRNKTYGFEHPKLEYGLISHYLRGYIDGDGCYYCGGRKNQLGFRHTIEIVSKTKEPLEWFREFLEKHDISPKVYHIKGQDKWKLYIMSKNDIIKALSLIYDGANEGIMLKRKYEKSKELLEIAVNGGDIVEYERAKSVKA